MRAHLEKPGLLRKPPSQRTLVSIYPVKEKQRIKQMEWWVDEFNNL